MSGIVFLSGAVKAAYASERVGFMLNPDMGNRIPAGATFALDNGVYGAWQRGAPHDVDRWLRWLDRQPREGCLFAIAPDIIGDPWGSWDRSFDWFPRIRAMGFPVAFAAQNGFDLIEDDRWSWDAFDALFLGGGLECYRCDVGWPPGTKVCAHCAGPVTEWKLGSWAEWATSEAKRHGKTVHMGRVNSGRRLRLAASWGVDSVDGTYLARTGPPGLAAVESWLELPAA